MVAELIQIYYKPEHLKELYGCAKSYENKNLTIFFENSVIADLVMNREYDKIGVCSWKLRQKMKWYIPAFAGSPRIITQDLLESDYDVLSFTHNTKYHQMLAAADNWHTGFKEALSKICSSIGISMPSEVKSPIYQNSFMASREIYQDYVKTYLNPSMESIKNDPEINKLAMQDSHYSDLAKKDAASPEYLQEQIGIPYYPLIPFLLERLFSIYVHNRKINVTWL